MDWPIIFAFGDFIVVVGGIIAGILVIRSSITKAEIAIKERILNDLGKENDLLRNRVERVEKDNKRLENLIQTLMAMLKKIYHIEIEIDGDVVYMRSPNGTHSSRIPTTGP